MVKKEKQHINFAASEMLFKPGMQESLDRLRAFWGKDMLNYPPIRIRYPLDGVSDEEWQESCEKAESHFAYWENLNKQKKQLPDDDLLVAAVYHGPAFMGGVLGMPVIFGKGSSWNEHNFTDYSMLPDLRKHKIDSKNEWINFMREQVLYFTENAAGSFPVGTNLFTGPGDIMGAIRGISEIYLDMILSPEKVTELARICTDAYIKATQLCFDMIPSLEGGYCDYYSLWTPGRSCMIDNDLSVGVSPEVYMDILFPFDCEAADSMDTPWMHTHSAQARLIPEFLQIPMLQGLQIVNDGEAGPSVEELIPMMKLVQKEHCLLLRKFSFDELDLILQEISPEGLYIDTQCDSFVEAEEYLGKWRNRW